MITGISVEGALEKDVVVSEVMGWEHKAGAGDGVIGKRVVME